MISGNRHCLRGALLALVLLAGGPGAAAAADPPAWGVEQLMHGLSRAPSTKGKFVERKYLAMLTAPLDSAGTLVYTAPGRLEKNTLTPKPERLVLDQDNLTLEYPDRGQRRVLALQNYPVVWAFVESIRSTLAGDLQTLNRFYRASVTGSEEQWRLSLKPVDGKMQSVVQEIRIDGRRDRVRTIEIIETQGDRSVMTITEDGP